MLLTTLFIISAVWMQVQVITWALQVSVNAHPIEDIDMVNVFALRNSLQTTVTAL